MGFRSLLPFLLLLIGIYGFSEAYYPHLVQHAKGNYFGGFQDPKNHGHFYLPGQTEYLKRPILPEQSSNTDLLQNFNYHGHFQHPGSADPFQQLNKQSELQKLAKHNKLGFRTSPRDYQQLYYHDMTHYPDQFHQLTYPDQIHLHNQQTELDNIGYLRLSPFHNSDDGYHGINYHSNLNYPSQHYYFSQDHQHYEQEEPEQLGNVSQLQPNNSIEKHQHPDYHDKPSSSDQSQQLSYLKQDQHLNQPSEHKLSNEVELHPSTGEHKQLDNHDMLNHSNQSQHLNYSDQNQQLNQQDEREKLSSHLYNSESETHQTNDQFQQLNSSEVGQLNHQDNLKELVDLNQPKIDNSVEEHSQINYRSMHNHPVQLQELNHFSQDQHLNNLNQALLHNFPGDQQQNHGKEVPLVPQHNEPEPSKLPSYYQTHGNLDQPVDFGHLHPIENHGYYPNNLPQLSNVGLHPQLDQLSRSDGYQHSNGPELSRYAREDPQLTYHGNAVPAVQQHNDQNLLSYIQEHEHPNQPVKSDQLHLTQKNGYPDSSLQLGNVGLQQQHDQQSVSELFQHLNEPQLPRYLSEGQKPIYRDNITAAPGLQDIPEYSNPSYISSFPHPVHRDLPGQVNYRRSPERFDYSSLQQQLTNPARFQQLPQQFGQFGQLMNPNNLPNPVNFRQFYDPNLFRQFGFPSNPLERSYNKRAGPDIGALATEVENNEKYPFPHISDHQQQQGYLKHNKEFLNPDESARYPSNLLQSSNPAYFRPINQQNPFTQNEHSSEPQLRSYLGESQMPDNHDFSSIKDPMLENSETHLKQTSNHQQQQGLPEQEVESKDINMNEKSNNSDHLQQQSNPDMFHQLNQSKQLEKPENSSELQQHTYSTNHQHLNFSSNQQDTAENFTTLDQIHLEKQEHPKQVVNSTDKNLTQKSNYSNQFHQLNISDNISKNNNTFHPEQQVNLNQTQQDSNSTTNQQLNYTSESQQSNSSNQSQLNNVPIKLQNVSSQMEHSINSSETNVTNNQSRFQEHSPVTNFKQNDNSDSAIRTANLDEQQLRNSFTGYRQQNHSDSFNDSISANKSENVTANLQPSQPYTREQRQLEIPNYESPMQYFFRSSQPQKFNPFNQINKPNLLPQPMDQHNHASSLTDNPPLNYPIPPAICYLEKTHGPCGEIIPSFFYNTVTKHCERFIYGGCLGNANNFATFEECESVCTVYPETVHAESKYPQQWDYDDVPALPLWHPGPALVHEFCSLEKSVGPCRAMFRRYFFNTATKTCEEFIYGGCYGNANNFFTKEECEFICRSIK